jgi:hypothetical protein
VKKNRKSYLHRAKVVYDVRMTTKTHSKVETAQVKTISKETGKVFYQYKDTCGIVHKSDVVIIRRPNAVEIVID